MSLICIMTIQFDISYLHHSSKLNGVLFSIELNSDASFSGPECLINHLVVRLVIRWPFAVRNVKQFPFVLANLREKNNIFTCCRRTQNGNFTDHGILSGIQMVWNSSHDLIPDNFVEHQYYKNLNSRYWSKIQDMNWLTDKS